tara:strand:+ start:51 stop:1025 length:975 start_codon:yes stop_codon:yes gene_type:complete
MKIAILGKIHSDGLEFLRSKNLEVLEINTFEENELISLISDVEGIIIRTANLNENLLSKCKNLKIVARHGVGYDNIDLNYLNKKNIALAITGQSNAVSVAEHVMTMMLTLSKNIFASDSLTRSNGFEFKAELPDFFELYQKKILILGFGRIGQALAKRCLGFEMEVMVYDPYLDNKIISTSGCSPVNLTEGFKIADYISIHLPLNNETKNLISDEEFKLFKKNLILINTARGGIVNEDAMYKALRSKQIYAAGIDVFEKEPPPKNHQLFKLENIILTPHNSALTLECRKRMSMESCINVLNYLNNVNELNKKNIVNLNNLNFRD